MTTPRSTAPATPVLAVACRMLRSPSHESVTTDLSLFSVSSLASEALGRHRIVTFKTNEGRGPSPNPEMKANINKYITRPADIPEVMWFEEGNDLIRSCAALSSILGMQKSFSTSDITQLILPETNVAGTISTPIGSSRLTASELALNSLQRCGYLIDHPRLDHASRSCSTWVAVGELASTSQLPSPHGGQSNVPTLSSSPPQPAFTAADLIRSVNKKVRQNYIRKRLLTTYRALERLSQSEFNLDRLEAAAAAATANCGPGPTELIVPTQNSLAMSASAPSNGSNTSSSITNTTSITATSTSPAAAQISTATTTPTSDKQQVPKNALTCPQLKKKIALNISKNLTIHDIERERGKPLSKYERNMMIFNWLHSLDETSMLEDDML